MPPFQKILIAVVMALTTPAMAVTVTIRQSGNTVTPNSVPYWVTNGIIGDSVTSADSPVSSFGVTNNGGSGICVNSARAATGNYNALCLGAATNAPATISLQNYGSAAPQNLNFILNGVPVTIPTGGGTYIFGNGPFTIGDVPCFSNVNGVIHDCGLALADGVITAGTWQGSPIGLSYGGTGATSASGARTSLGLGTMAQQNATAVAITGGTATGLPIPVNPTDVAIKSYVDATSTGLNILAPSALATAAALPNSPTYANGSSGVGATLTAGSNTTLTVDGTVAVLNTVVLVIDQVSTFQNGIYTVTQAGSGSAPWILTRATYFNTSAQMKTGSYTFVTGGSVNINTSWTLQSTVATVGTSAVTFIQFSSGSSGSVTSIATGPGLTGGPITTNGTISIDYTHNNTWTGPNSFSNSVVFTGTNQNQGNTYFGGQPWFDVKSTAHGCAAAVGDGSTDDTVAIQCHINYMNTTTGGGTIFFPPSTTCYLVSGGGLIVPTGIWLVGPSIDSTCIEVATNSIVIETASCPSGGLNSGIDRLSIYGYQNASVTQPAILVASNCVFNIYNSRVWFGTFALNTAGADGTVFNTYLCGYSGCIQSTGANWYERVKMDIVVAGTIPTTYGFAQGVSTAIQENHFVNTDFSCSCTQSLFISDGHNVSITGILNSVLDSPVVLTNQRNTQFVADEIGSTSFTASAGTTYISSTFAFNSTTIGGGGGLKCSTNSNSGFTNC